MSDHTSDQAPIKVEAGDVLLFTPSTSSPKSRALGEAIKAIDGSAFSHTVIVFEEGGHTWFASANQADEQHAVYSGVNRLDPSLFAHRYALILRHTNDAGTRAAKHARSWIEHGPRGRNPADFGWFILGVSGLAAIARHLEPGTGARRRIEGFACWLTKRALDGVDPCGWGQNQPDPKTAPVDRFYCASFVEHAFCAVDAPLGIIESDPSPRDFEGMVWRLVNVVQELFCAGSLTDPVMTQIDDLFPDELFDGIEGAGNGDVRKLFRTVLKMIWCNAGRPPVPVVEDLDIGGTEIGQPVYPPFVGLRHLRDLPRTRREIEVVNPDDSLILVGELDFGNIGTP